MKATATELANDSKAILDKVIRHGETVEVQRHGRTIAVIRPKEGVSMQELLERLNKLDWTDKERKELWKAIKEGGKVVGNAGSC